MTKSSINRLGKNIRHKIRDGVDLSEDDLNELQVFRTSFKEDIAPVFQQIADLSKTERKDTVVSFRIKRIESILSKIRREPTMALGNMGDIAGCRVITYSEPALRNIIQKIHEEFIVRKVNDYTIEAKDDGYRGYHVYVQSPINVHKTVEIQVRSINTHKWASLVEIIDILYDLKLKEGEKHPDLQEFLQLLSLPKLALSIKDKKRIIDVDKKYEIYSNLNEVFITNHISIRKYWLELSESTPNNYFIIEVDENKKSNIISISDYEKAEHQYFEKFKSNNNSNFVLTYIQNPNFKKICVAYASYVMIKHDYLADWSIFAKDIIAHEKEKKVLDSFTLYLEYFQRNLEDQKNLVDIEIEEVQKHLKSTGDKKTYGVKEWINELAERNKNLQKFIEEIGDKKPNSPRGLFRWLFKD